MLIPFSGKEKEFAFDYTINGTSSDDIIWGRGGNQTFFGAAGDDQLKGGAGDDTLDGGTGIDTAIFSGNPLDYDVRKNADGSWTVRDVRGAADEGTDTLKNIEKIQFGDSSTYDLKAHGLTFQSDLSLVIDTTGSMGPYIGGVKSDALALINAAFGGGTKDAQIGIVGFKDVTNGEPSSIILPFTDQDDFAARMTAANNAIQGIGVGGGGDTPETDFNGLQLALDTSIFKWRSGAGKLDIILFTDAPAKDGSLEAAVAAAAKKIGAVISGHALGSKADATVDTFTLSFSPADGGAKSALGEKALADGSDGDFTPDTTTATVRVFTIHVGSAFIDTTPFEAISRDTGGSFLVAPTPEQLLSYISEIISAPPSSGPTAIDLDSASVAENALAGTAVGTFAVTDPDAADTFTFALDPSVTDFVISGNKLVIAAGAMLDFETRPNINVPVTVTDSAGNSLTVTKTIVVTNVNETPTNVALAPMTVAENSASGTVVGTVSVTDPDAGDGFTLALDPTVKQFVLNGTTLKVAPGADIDFEDTPSIPVIIKATDSGGLSLTKTLTITVQDVAESFIGTEGPDTIRGDAGNNDIRGLGGNDVLTGGKGNDTIDAGAGNDSVNGGAGTDILHLGAGSDTVRGPATDLDGDTIDDFGLGDAIVLANALLSRSGLALSGSGAATKLALSDGASTLATLGIGGVIGSADLMIAHSGTDSWVSWQKYLPALTEKVAVASDSIQGIANPQYLNGDTASSFTVSIESISQAKLDNSLGVYEIDTAGHIVDVRIIALNVKTAVGPITVTGIDAGHQLGFFLVQNGAHNPFLSATGTTNLSIIAQGTGLALAKDGAAVPGAVTFFSHDPNANPDGVQHVLSGVSSDGSGAIRIGFEDLLHSNKKYDGDFQDLVITVKAEDGSHLAASVEARASAFHSPLDFMIDDLGFVGGDAETGSFHPLLQDHVLYDWALL